MSGVRLRYNWKNPNTGVVEELRLKAKREAQKAQNKEKAMFKVKPPFLKEEKKPGPTCNPTEYTNRIKPNSFMKCNVCPSTRIPK